MAKPVRKAKSRRTTAKKTNAAPQRKTVVKVEPRSRSGGNANPWASLKPMSANFTPLSPISFLPRAAEIHPGRIAVIHGKQRHSYAEFYARARRLASALAKRGVKRGEVVSVMLPNVPAMLEAHYGVPMAGAVLNTINTRLDADTVAYILEHG